ncbi:hypothetical protein CsSME_00032909 [Camellia sinensis var. sinensis]
MPSSAQTFSEITLSLCRRRCPLPPPRPVLLSPPHPPPRRKAPKAVNEDLYRFSPELLRAKHRRVSLFRCPFLFLLVLVSYMPQGPQFLHLNVEVKLYLLHPFLPSGCISSSTSSTLRYHSKKMAWLTRSYGWSPISGSIITTTEEIDADVAHSIKAG